MAILVRRRLAFSLSILVCLASAVSAQSEQGVVDTNSDAGADEAWHVVRPNDTLRGLATLYLGRPDAWQEILALNPEISDQNLIYPGQRIHIRVEAGLEADAALIEAMSNRVEQRPTPLEWEGAVLQQLLRKRDGVRTFGGASAELVFGDETRLVLTEDSLVFLREEGAAVEPVDRRLIEVVVGQADLEATAQASAEDDIEIVVGNARSRPQRDQTGALRTRTRLSASRAAQVMVFEGQADVEAGEGAVKVDAGMGTSVPEGGAPTPPEALLPAPVLTHPQPGVSLPVADAEIRWQPVEGAVGYVAELCREAGCGALVERVTGLDVPRWRPSGIEASTLYVRVNAVSPSGLDGYPSTAQAIVFVSEPPDEVPPRGRVRFLGTQVQLPDDLVLGAETRVALITEDDRSEVTSTLRFDDEPAASATLDGGWTPGPHRLEVTLEDRAGNRTELEPIVFVHDPRPPLVRWQLGGERGEARGQATSEAPAEGASLPQAPKLEWSRNGERWQRLERQSGIQAVGPTLWLRVRGKPVRLGDGDLVLTRKQPLRLEAHDEESKAVNLTVQVLGRGGGRSHPLLVVRAIDLVDNRTRVSWPLVPGPR